MLALLAIATLLAPLAGCGTSPDLSEGIGQLEAGDSAERAIELIGKPDRKTNAAGAQQWHYESVITRDDGKQATLTVKLVVRDDVVLAIHRSSSPFQ